MRANLFSVLLLPSAVTASFLEAIMVDSDATTTLSTPAKPTVSNPSLNEAFSPHEAHLDLRAAQPQPTAPIFALHAPNIPRAYNPDPINLAFNAGPEDIGKREVVTGAAQGVAATANVGPTQYPTVTTQWPEMAVNGVPTWIPVTYTQTFAQVPQQLPSPGVGSIGYGDETSTKEKRQESGGATRPTWNMLGVLFGTFGFGVVWLG
ncbi:hypothetical protein NA57DRAFT_71121 [Rhizodiscina lignyota]|uniref:Uncharacterized protein n=1 Tax=Rhizodiscina lignyota TaxID=1504668 RepID=A0A9P4MC11_9PEZI|nr:hypothetical protein NA57DRAFT_71121 [Rhizodiscina lignyota]